jgi:D-alanyl-D-alanine carboxypeptidase (penicillin-binding protein 5/6)
MAKWCEFPVQSLEQVDQAGIFGRAWDSIRMMMK